MIKAYINVLFMLFAAWGVYFSCQGDSLLPSVVGGLMLLTILMRARSSDKEYAGFGQLPISVIIIGSVLFGFVWRNFVPPPSEASSPFPEFTAALQSGSILASLLIWLRPFNRVNMFRLTFCSWLTVGLSINVPFSVNRLIIFSAFCFIAIIVVILNTMHRPDNKKYLFGYFRDYIIYAAILIFMTTGLFFVISRSIVALDDAFLNLMSDFVLPRQYTNFLRISPRLNLISPGLSAFDRRIVLEVSVPKTNTVYLKNQVFEDYDNGTWVEPKVIEKTILPDVLPTEQKRGQMTMFTSLENIIPSADRITGVKGRGTFLIGPNEIVYSQEKPKTRILEFSMGRQLTQVDLSVGEYNKYTALPESIAPQLREIARNIVVGRDSNGAKAIALVHYFQQNYTYSLETNFSGDEKGMIKMLTEKSPAYCTYFASALALLLRAEGIPSRVVAGFMTDELIDPKNTTFIARVKNAHAWTEALLPVDNHNTGKTYIAWIRLDATPFIAGTSGARVRKFDLERMLEKGWLNILRFTAQIENIGKERLKIYGILFLMGVMAWINRVGILRAFRRWLARKQTVKTVHYKVSDELLNIYRQYERHLQERYNLLRRASDTDADVIRRLRDEVRADPSSLESIEKFIKEFQSARFGGKEGSHLKEKLSQLVNLK